MEAAGAGAEGAEVQVATGRVEGSHIFYNGDGYYYHLRELRGMRARMKCRHYNTGCRGTAAVNMNTGILRPLQDHICQSDFLLIDDMNFRRVIIEAASTSAFGQGVRAILRQKKLECPNVDLARRFTTARMHSAMHAARSSSYPEIPKTLIYLGVLLGLPDFQPICRTVDGTDYIFRGVIGNVRDRTVSVIFASGRMLAFMESRQNIHFDGTFKKRPRKPKCGQIYNAVTNFNSTVIALARVLMMSRTAAAYTVLFNHFKMLMPNLNPELLYCDFERAQINSLRLVFPNSNICGCLWHYGVCVSSKARKLGLGPLAAGDDEAYFFIQILCGAALLPSELIERGVEENWQMVQDLDWAPDFLPLMEYFRDEWLPRKNELSVFNVPERTNNCSESDNRMLANVVPQNHPNIYRLIGGFVQAEHLSWCDKLAIDVGETVTGARRWKAVFNDRRIERLSGMLVREEITPGHFVRAASFANLAAVTHGLRLGAADSESEDSDDSD